MEKGMANHFSIFALRTPWTVWKGKKVITLKDDFPRSVGAQYTTGEEWKNNSRKNEETEPKWKQCPVVDVTGDGRKAHCCEEQYYIGTWNVRSMNQGKLEVVTGDGKSEHQHFRNSELKWTGICEFNSDDHYIYHCGPESLRRNGEAIVVNKSLKCSTWMQG